MYSKPTSLLYEYLQQHIISFLCKQLLQFDDLLTRHSQFGNKQKHIEVKTNQLIFRFLFSHLGLSLIACLIKGKTAHKF